MDETSKRRGRVATVNAARYRRPKGHGGRRRQDVAWRDQKNNYAWRRLRDGGRKAVWEMREQKRSRLGARTAEAKHANHVGGTWGDGEREVSCRVALRVSGFNSKSHAPKMCQRQWAGEWKMGWLAGAEVTKAAQPTRGRRRHKHA